MWRDKWNGMREMLADNWVELAAWTAVVLLFTLAFLCFRFVLDRGGH